MLAVSRSASRLNRAPRKGNVAAVNGLTRWVLGLGALPWAVLGGCQSSADSKASPTEKRSAPPPSETNETPTLDPIVHVPVGAFEIGSAPGDLGRQPDLEPLLTPLELGPFRIARAPQLLSDGNPEFAASVEAAEARCASAGGRLCTEVEWERACKGNFGLTLPGTAEWTASRFGTGSAHEGKQVWRGLTKTDANAANSCARRAVAEERNGALIRCCYGAPNAPRIPEPADGPAFQTFEFGKDELRALLASDPKTAELAATADLFSDEAAATVLSRGPGQTMGFELTTRALEWRPTLGVRFLVVAGRADPKTAFIVLYHLGGSKKLLAGSFLMKNEPGPVALAYAPSIRPRVHFSNCWGCPGETGKALFRPPDSVVLLQP